MKERVTRAVWMLAAVSLLLAALGVLVFLLGTIGVRLPYWGEAEVVFEAGRVREGLPLFVDPLVGAADHGLPPSRYFVTYPPLLTYLTSLFPATSALVCGRVLASRAWVGALAWMALGAAPDCRRTAVAAAMFVSGLWILANFATVGRPDAVACAFAAVGLTRGIRARRLDALAIVLLVLAFWIKPTVLGLPVGAVAVDALVQRRLGGIVIALVSASAVLAALYWASDGALVHHIIRSNAQPLTLAVWLDHVPGRLPFFAPLFGLAAWSGYRNRADAGIAIGLGALGGAVGWSVIAIAKTGSAANYWMEPCVAAVALLARAESPYVFARSSLAHAAPTLGVVLLADVASMRGSLEHLRSYRAAAAFVAAARDTCGASRTDLVASDEQGIELALNDRILAPAYQMSWLVRAGHFPASVWTHDLASPNIRCFIARPDALGAAPEVRAAVDTSFVEVARGADMRLLRKRLPGSGAISADDKACGSEARGAVPARAHCRPRPTGRGACGARGRPEAPSKRASPRPPRGRRSRGRDGQ